jgi:hypothetical protein
MWVQASEPTTLCLAALVSLPIVPPSVVVSLFVSIEEADVIRLPFTELCRVDFALDHFPLCVELPFLKGPRSVGAMLNPAAFGRPNRLADINAAISTCANINARQRSSAQLLSLIREKPLSLKFQETGRRLLPQLKRGLPIKSLGCGVKISFACKLLKFFELDSKSLIRPLFKYEPQNSGALPRVAIQCGLWMVRSLRDKWLCLTLERFEKTLKFRALGSCLCPRFTPMLEEP